VCAFLAGIFPQSLCGIEFWGVGRQIVDFNPFAVFPKPIPNVSVLMIGSAVLNVVNTAVFFEELADGRLQENHVGRGVEDFVDHIFELRCVKVNAAKNFYGFPFSRDWDVGLTPNPRPSSVQR